MLTFLLAFPANSALSCPGRLFSLTGRPALTRKRSTIMAWNTPKVTEIPLGGEINSYVCGEKK
ncbi:pyrroloquinoline quinone precursor peptide PqqA [Bombella dulcis]|uniref:pyrroloquinoline quinone precursor peptide PqqA n=1 Tax=Bombella dulcis TaxID=2967339 RepID=UPI002B256862|nr:pyrroloquinoline quinone precursor peptide PqqA [Bombella dulcis]